MAGDPLTRRDRQKVARAVDDAERATGLQLAVYVGPVDTDPHEQAERLLQESGALAAPAVLLLVVPELRRVEIRTSPTARERVSDETAAAAIAAMTPLLAEGDLVGGVKSGLNLIAAAAGPSAEEGPELPDVLTP